MWYPTSIICLFFLLTVALKPLCHWNQCKNIQRTRYRCPNEWLLLSLNHPWKEKECRYSEKLLSFYSKRTACMCVYVDPRDRHGSHGPLQLQFPAVLVQTDNLRHPRAEPLRHLLNRAGHRNYLYFSSVVNDEGVWWIRSEDVSPRRLRALLVIPSACIIPKESQKHTLLNIFVMIYFFWYYQTRKGGKNRFNTDSHVKCTVLNQYHTQISFIIVSEWYISKNYINKSKGNFIW